jgi:histidinol-phosphatase
VTAPSPDPGFVTEVVTLARAGAEMAADAYRAGRVEADHKADGSVVTPTDLAVEQFLRERILERYPNDAVVGEEQGSTAGTSGRRWVLDPIDGTEAFARGVGEFCTLVAVEDEFGPFVGVIAVPILDETVWAGRGLGAFLNGVPARVSARTQLNGAFVATSDLDDWPDAALAGARAAGLRPRTWGGGYGIALAVTGRVDAFVDYDVDLWDVAPVAVIASEASGRFSALDGSARADRGTVLVSNGVLHDALLEVFPQGGTWP